MNEPIAYLDGEMLPQSRATLPVWDAGFVLGTTVVEQLRTFGGSLFHVEDHLSRLYRSLELVGTECPLSQVELTDIVTQVAEQNWPLLDPADDLGVSIFVTPGDSPSLTDGASGRPRVGVHSFPLAFGLWAEKYELGQRLVITDTRHVPEACWPTEIKCRSRMHYHLADREAQSRQAGARALLLDIEGNVAEASTANVVIYREAEGLLAPPMSHVLPGVSIRVLLALAKKLGIPTSERNLLPQDVLTADEVLLSSTPFCILPVSEVDQKAIGSGCPGRAFQQLLTAFGEQVGLDIAAQARRFARRENAS